MDGQQKKVYMGSIPSTFIKKGFITIKLALHMYSRSIGLVEESSPMARETGVQSQVESYERLKKWYLIPPCLTLSIIRYASGVKWSTLEKGAAPSPTPRCSSYWKRSLRVAFDYGHQLYFFTYISLETCLVHKEQIFAYTQLNDQTVLFQTIQLNMSIKLNVSKYCAVSLIIQLNISHHLFTNS